MSFHRSDWSLDAHVMSPEVKRTQEQWRVIWMGGEKVSDVEKYGAALGWVGFEISGDAIRILERKGFFK